jgi:tetratricopeptide (TPR) repeat protein
MNAEPQRVSENSPAPEAPAIDERNPWLGLASFTEETRAYFFGREEEVAELARRVQRKLLTVLFGQSGLGKTSILRAGLVPRLRTQGYCPVYVRIDYGRDAPEPAVQIKQAIARTARRAGEWTQAGVAVEGESLWEFLHHRDDVLRDESGATLIPLLIFDQFEEIFTLAQSDDFGRARAARFITDLADLVENRPPKDFEAKIEADESAAEHFDFARSDYRVLIALREDYLAPLEGLKVGMPSVTQNRLRLARMTGQQALAAVMQPGKRLVSEEVAAAIVRFVAGGAELANAEVEPSLLSLICRELNDTRIAQGRSEISLDLLAGSHASILSNFYERSLADQPPAIRHIIEDELLTDSGFRENVAEERLLSSFAAVGAAPNTLAVLVNRRLLRIEERLDIRRVELTHDVLCGVVRKSRDLRREREARDATERLLAEQRERELAARRALVRARKVAAGCSVLAIAALGAAVLAYFSNERAHRAERQAEETRAAAEQARGQAEHLLAYLTDDFASELETFGRMDVVADLAKRQIDYFKSLPPALQVADTLRDEARALVHYAAAMRVVGNPDAANAAATEGIVLLEQLRRGGDASEATVIALAKGLAVQSRVLYNQANPSAVPTVDRAVALLKPIAEAPNASGAVRATYVQVLIDMGYERGDSDPDDKVSVPALRLAQRIATELGARNLSNIEMSAYYAEAGARLDESLMFRGGTVEEARRVAADAEQTADKVLAVRPVYLLALHAKGIIDHGFATMDLNELRPTEAIDAAKRAEADQLTLTRLDANNTVSRANANLVEGLIGDAYWASGRPREAIVYYRQRVEESRGIAKSGVGWLLSNYLVPVAVLAINEADAGDKAGATASLAAIAKEVSTLRQASSNNRFAVQAASCVEQNASGTMQLLLGDAVAAQKAEREAAALGRGINVHSDLEKLWQTACIWLGSFGAAQASYLLGDLAATESTVRVALDAHKHWFSQTESDKRDDADITILLALTLAREGKTAESQHLLDPVLKYHRGLAAHNHGDEWQHVQLASALYAKAVAEPRDRAALLKEASALVAHVPAAMGELHSVRLWRDRIHEGVNFRTAPAARTARTSG